MDLATFWDKYKQREYEGHIHIGPTSRTHCTSCDGGNKLLSRGIGVHFLDAKGQEIFVTGPDCFKKHTDIVSLSQIPTIGFGFSDVKTGKTRLTSPKLSTTFTKAVAGLSSDQEKAYAEIMLRARILPSMGFRLSQPGLKKYLAENFPYEDKIIKEITRYVENGISRFRLPALDQLFRAHYVAHQIDALKEKRLWPGERNFVESIEKSLKEKFGLTDKQMIALERAAHRHGLLLQKVGIRFPENQSRFQDMKSQIQMDIDKA